MQTKTKSNRISLRALRPEDLNLKEEDLVVIKEELENQKEIEIEEITPYDVFNKIKEKSISQNPYNSRFHQPTKLKPYLPYGLRDETNDMAIEISETFVEKITKLKKEKIRKTPGYHKPNYLNYIKEEFNGAYDSVKKISKSQIISHSRFWRDLEEHLIHLFYLSKTKVESGEKEMTEEEFIDYISKISYYTQDLYFQDFFVFVATDEELSIIKIPVLFVFVKPSITAEITGTLGLSVTNSMTENLPTEIKHFVEILIQNTFLLGDFRAFSSGLSHYPERFKDYISQFLTNYAYQNILTIVPIGTMNRFVEFGNNIEVPNSGFSEKYLKVFKELIFGTNNNTEKDKLQELETLNIFQEYKKYGNKGLHNLTNLTGIVDLVKVVENDKKEKVLEFDEIKILDTLNRLEQFRYFEEIENTYQQDKEVFEFLKEKVTIEKLPDELIPDDLQTMRRETFQELTQFIYASLIENKVKYQIKKFVEFIIEEYPETLV